MRSMFRLLPMTVMVAAVLLLVKVVQTVETGQDIWGAIFIPSVVAQEKSDAPAEESNATEATETSETPETPAKTPDAHGESEGEGAEHDATKKAEDDGDIMGGFIGEKKKKLGPEDLVGNQLGGLRPDDRRFSPIELKLLQQLSARRKDIDKREEQLILKENLLTQTEKRVDEKFQEMQTLKTELADVIAQYKEVEETKIRSLVKIYENMKPKDAARIFDELEIPILIMVVDKMSEKKAAPVIAAMDSKKAKMLTVELAVKRKQEDAMARKEAASQ